MSDLILAEMLHCNDWRSNGYVVPLMELAAKRACLNSSVIDTEVS